MGDVLLRPRLNRNWHKKTPNIEAQNNKNLSRRETFSPGRNKDAIQKIAVAPANRKNATVRDVNSPSANTDFIMGTFNPKMI
jgi:hypothetical protein